ncbi:ABC transporter ATP-binding protein [Ruminococcus sp.]|uniref:ABC transporter ATP-binding protein n=1 Tax=Ruminococcus sp. TaxID=41978 RepID=UPI002E79FD8A|nr:ABC transporter ATP-binding protein [Ruminococcus sp.]MEE0023274.1 ABC transporter ATP-binding protein [Ruminococcus sp.]
MLQIKDVKFKYNKDKDAKMILNGTSADFKEGVFYSIYGPSGSGKTTLLSILGGLEKPMSGTVTIDGLGLDKIGLSHVRNKYISYIFQNYLLFPYMSALENIIVSMDINDCIYTNKRELATTTLLSLGLDKTDINRKVNKLSGGQQQRVAIARSIISPAKYILADEPTGNLDKDNSINIIHILDEMVRNHNKCLIVVTHSDYVRAKSDISYLIDDGKLQ